MGGRGIAGLHRRYHGFHPDFRVPSGHSACRSAAGWHPEPSALAGKICAYTRKNRGWLQLLPEFSTSARYPSEACGMEKTPVWAVRSLVGARGFEPPTSASRRRRSTRLSHAPILFSGPSGPKKPPGIRGPPFQDLRGILKGIFVPLPHFPARRRQCMQLPRFWQ